MRSRSDVLRIALLIIFSGMALLQFSGDVRPVQVVGLYAAGAVMGVAIASIAAALHRPRVDEKTKNTIL